MDDFKVITDRKGTRSFNGNVNLLTFCISNAAALDFNVQNVHVDFMPRVLDFRN